MARAAPTTPDVIESLRSIRQWFKAIRECSRHGVAIFKRWHRFHHCLTAYHRQVMGGIIRVLILKAFAIVYNHEVRYYSRASTIIPRP
jgi:hypothetical protein